MGPHRTWTCNSIATGYALVCGCLSRSTKCAKNRKQCPWGWPETEFFFVTARHKAGFASGRCTLGVGTVWERVPATFPERAALALDDCIPCLACCCCSPACINFFPPCKTWGTRRERPIFLTTENYKSKKLNLAANSDKSGFSFMYTLHGLSQLP